MAMRKLTAKAKLFVLGLLLGAGVSFPLGMNFGRDEPLLSNPMAKIDVKEQVVETVKRSTESVLEGAREKIHQATEPLASTN